MKAETFHAPVQKQMRIQIPRLLRWKYKLAEGAVLRVQLTNESSVTKQFFAVTHKDGRIAIPKTIAAVLKLNPKQIVEASIWLPPEEQVTRQP